MFGLVISEEENWEWVSFEFFSNLKDIIIPVSGSPKNCWHRYHIV